MNIELRKDGTAVIDGYVNVVGRESRVLMDVSGKFIEVIAPKTFQKALEKNNNVGLMFNHTRNINPVKMELYEDNIGLRAITEINDEEIIEKAKNGKLTGWSFGFYLNADEWETKEDGMRLRTVSDLDLIEVSILDCTPAYIATSIEMRGDIQALKEIRNNSDNVEVVDNTEPETNMGDIMRQKKRKFNFTFNLI